MRDWRNLASLDLDIDARFLVLWGANGVGKTNLLEALSVLCAGRSFRNCAWADTIRWGQTASNALIHLQGVGGNRRLRVEVGSGGRTFYMDGSPVRDLGKYLLAVRAVVFTPADTAIIRGSPEVRRRFMDRAAFNHWPAHLVHVRVFRRALAQKSALLRSGRVDLKQLEAWNERIAVLGARVVHGRSRIVVALQGPLNRVHRMLSGGSVSALRHRSVLGEGEEDLLAKRYAEILHEHIQEEIRRGTNMTGPQRDDLEIRFHPGAVAPGQPSVQSPLPLARTFASQGQVRTLALSLKLAELIVAGSTGDPPLMLLDDLSSELDQERLGRLVSLLEELKTQVVVTTTDPDSIMGRLSSAGQAIRIGADVA